MSAVDIARIPKVALLRALWEKQKIAGFYSHMPYAAPAWRDPEPDFDWDPDYYLGRAIKTRLRDDLVYPKSYNRDAGEGAFEAVVQQLRIIYP
jgi:hypothetical protein